MPVIEAADLNDLDFFIWNWWMAYQEGGVPAPLKDESFLNMLSKKMQQERNIQESVLSIMGTLFLASCEIPENFLKMINPEKALQICKHAQAEEKVIKFIRLIGGLIALSLKEHIDWIKEKGIPDILKITFDLEVPNQAIAIKKLKEFCSNT